jgi:putative glutathione S-transferase
LVFFSYKIDPSFGLYGFPVQPSTPASLELGVADILQSDTHNFAEKDGQFRRKASAFRNLISSDPSSEFPAAKDRYALYIHIGCPWAHRTNIVRSLKGLEDIIQLIVWDKSMVNEGVGWAMSGVPGFEKEQLYGFTNLKQLYEKADPQYEGRYLVPTLWDKDKGSRLIVQ